MLHGDLHSGSVMVTQDDTRVIDPEFAFFGPIGFDVGAFIANLLLAYFAQDGLGEAEGERAEFQGWLLETMERFATQFQTLFLQLWRKSDGGDAFDATLFVDDASVRALEAFRQRTMQRLFRDTIGFAGAKMARRILGLAHVEDLEAIKNPDRRAACERRALCLAREMMVDAGRVESIGQLSRLAKGYRTG